MHASRCCGCPVAAATTGAPPSSGWRGVLFTPNETHDDEIFLVDNPEVVDAMGLESRGRDRYSLAFLLPGLPELERLAADAAAISEEGRTIVEREILRLWNNVGVYANLLSSFAFTYPHRDFQVDDQAAAELLGLPGTGTYSYLDVALRRAELRDAAMAAGVAHAASGAFSRSDGQLLRLSQSLAAWQGNFVGLPLPVIPVTGFGETRWLSPWQALDGSADGGARSGAAACPGDRAAGAARPAGGPISRAASCASDWRRASLPIRCNAVPRPSSELKDPRLEIFYNRTNPYLAARLAYGAGLLLLALSFLGLRTWLYRASFLLMLLGFIPHTFGLVLRILITDRPPVTNLFETFVFVGWGAVVCGVVMEYLRKRYLGVFCGLAGGFVFFLLSGKFSAEGDTMPVLQAVLDTNFWLSTHVTVITTGYMACCVAGLIGHVYMLQAVLQGRRGAASGYGCQAPCAHLPDHVRHPGPGAHLLLRGHHARGHLGRPVVGPLLGLGSQGERRPADRAVVRDPVPRPDGQDDRPVRNGRRCRAADHRGDAGVVRDQRARGGPALLRVYRRGSVGAGRVQRGAGGRSWRRWQPGIAGSSAAHRSHRHRHPRAPAWRPRARANGAARNTAPVVGDGSSGVAAATADR